MGSTRGSVWMMFGVLALLASLEGCGGSTSSTGTGATSGGCPTGQTSCEGTCTETKLDPANCGTCGNACATGEFCSEGKCVGGAGASTSSSGSTTSSSGAGGGANTSSSSSGSTSASTSSSGSATSSTSGSTSSSSGGSCTSPLMLCGGLCVETSSDPQNCGGCGTTCGATQACASSKCVDLGCPVGETTCGPASSASCVNTRIDPQNCGGCGFTCPTGKVCSNSSCGAVCGGKTSTDCSGVCVDPQSDNKNCGGCGNACPAGQVCSLGACAATCSANLLTCGSGSTAYCADPFNDPQNCGACGASCPSGQLCSGGQCQAFCAGDQSTVCNGLCVSTATDNANCGTCGNACTGGKVCSGGVCQATCSSAYTSCGAGSSATCVDTQNDPQNCGACGKACPIGQACSLGICAAACDGIQGTQCGGTCTNLQNDVNNCGSCNFKCSAGDVCSDGLCVTACGANQFTCTLGTTTFCTNASTDPANCGGCGKVCSGGKVCSNGTCGSTCASGFDTCGSGSATFCTDTDTDPNNCGGCGMACSPPAHGAAVSCSFGACGYACNPGYASVNNNNTCLPLTGISGGRFHTCGLTSTGGVMCWGDNTYGELGDGTVTSSDVPVTVLGLAPVAQVYAGVYSTCAAMMDGTVQCWGLNNSCQLASSPADSAAHPTPTAVKTLSNVIEVQESDSTWCALTSAGAIQCWGYGGHGELGNGTTATSCSPVVVTGFSFGATAISLAKDQDNGGYGQHACAIDSSGNVWCWGYNGFGQLGNNTTTDATTPVQIHGMWPKVVAISTGERHSCMLTSLGSVNCWGFNGNGELGQGTIGTPGTSLVPLAVVGLNGNVTALASGGFHNCVTTKTSATLCWGYNGDGELGDGTTTSTATPEQLMLPAGVTLTGVPSLAPLGSFAVSTAGPTYGWGNNGYGQLGDNTITNRKVLTPIE